MKDRNIENANESTKELWVWMLIFENINELEQSSELWSTKAAAQAEMEDSIKYLMGQYDYNELDIIREDDEHVELAEHFRWEIKKVKVNV